MNRFGRFSKSESGRTKTYKRADGYVLYEVFDKIPGPLYVRHPSLKPAEWEDQNLQQQKAA